MYRFDIIERWQEEHYSAKEAFELYRLWKWLKESTYDYAYIPCTQCNSEAYAENIDHMRGYYDRKKWNQKCNNDLLLNAITDIALSQVRR